MRLREPRVPAAESVVIDTDRWPVVRIQFPSRALSDAALGDFLERADEMLDTGGQCAAILDMERATFVPSATQRARFAGWMRANGDRNRRQIVGTAILAKSAILRGTITAIYWLQKPVTPQHVAADLGDAVRWCQTQLGVPAR